MKINCPGFTALCEMTTVYGRSAGTAVHALAYVTNALRAQGGEDVTVDVRIDMPEYMFKSRLHAIQKELKRAFSEHGITPGEIHVTKHGGVNLCAVTVEGMAVKASDSTEVTENSGKDVVLLGWPGMDGMLRIADEKESELRERFANTFFSQIRSYERFLFADELLKAVQTAGEKNPEIQEICEGGVFAALWNLAKEKQCGLDLDFKKINLLQETVEVCELYRLNPYQLTSAGAFLAMAEDGEVFAERLRGMGFPAQMIGRLTDDNDKILRNGEEIRYIDRPVPDEIFRIYEEKSEQGS